ncbi:hypothetical protein RJ639_013494 [Escallonia herrerae]|uniref:Cytochrome P450 n=1 Tax=Escallonia herrerae TaxID=1293975 RepID=A0AA88VIG6_9ASTE|nr:hypothetical protein RJ639_013494 [Escallonia herrerae]
MTLLLNHPDVLKKARAELDNLVGLERLVEESDLAKLQDPRVWEDPTSFKPERFETGEVEGHRLMPFGMGRRSCPGASLAQRVVGLVLASLIQCFEWVRVSENQIDLTEGTGLSMPKLEPLVAMCRARHIMDKIL